MIRPFELVYIEMVHCARILGSDLYIYVQMLTESSRLDIF